MGGCWTRIEMRILPLLLTVSSFALLFGHDLSGADDDELIMEESLDMDVELDDVDDELDDFVGGNGRRIC